MRVVSEGYEGLDPTANLTSLQRARLARSEAIRARLSGTGDLGVARTTPESPRTPRNRSEGQYRGQGVRRSLNEPCVNGHVGEWRVREYIRNDRGTKRKRTNVVCQACNREKALACYHRAQERKRKLEEGAARGLELHRAGKTIPLAALTARIAPLLVIHKGDRADAARALLDEMARDGQIVIVEVAGFKHAALIDADLGRAVMALDPAVFEDDGSRFARRRDAHKAAA